MYEIWRKIILKALSEKADDPEEEAVGSVHQQEVRSTSGESRK